MMSSVGRGYQDISYAIRYRAFRGQMLPQRKFDILAEDPKVARARQI
jgi:hypothetical protein